MKSTHARYIRPPSFFPFLNRDLQHDTAGEIQMSQYDLFVFPLLQCRFRPFTNLLNSSLFIYCISETLCILYNTPRPASYLGILFFFLFFNCLILKLTYYPLLHVRNFKWWMFVELITHTFITSKIYSKQNWIKCF